MKTAILERAAFDALTLSPTEKDATLSSSGARGSAPMVSTFDEAVCAMSDDSFRAMLGSTVISETPRSVNSEKARIPRKNPGFLGKSQDS